MKKILKITFLLLLIGSAGGGGYWYLSHRPSEKSNAMRVSGNIEVTEVEMSFKIPGRVLKRYVDEGEKIEKGALVAQLEDADLRQEVSLRTAELKAARAQLDELEEGSRKQDIEAAKAAVEKAKFALEDQQAGPRKQEIAAAEANVKAAASERDRALADYNRARILMERGNNAITKEQFDQFKSAYEVGAARVRDAEERLKLLQAGYREKQIKTAEAAWEQAKWQYDLVKEGPRRQDKEQAAAKVEQAEAALKLAETKVGYATLISPMTGVVLSKNIEPGEYVAPGTPVVTIGDMVNVWLRAYVPEPDLYRVKLKQKVRVTIDTNDKSLVKSYEGRISFISQQAEFTPKNVQTEKERVKLVHRIKIDITNPNMELKPGMPADGVIETEELSSGKK